MYDTFISYRRVGGKEIAPRVYDYLNGCGFDTFLDLSEMGSGRFDEQIRVILERAENFILILSPGALDRCVNEDDWVKVEISTAIRLNKNIIVFQSESFEYPEILPKEIESIKLYQAILYHDSTVHLQLKHVANMLKKDTGTAAAVSTGKTRASKRVSFRGEYITEYEDVENQRTVIRKAPARLSQFGSRIWGTTSFSEDKQWRIQGRVYNKKQIAGIYYATGYLDDGFGTFFLEAKSPTLLEGFWSGYDSVAKRVTSGRYVFYKKHNTHTVIPAKEEHYAAIVKIASARLGNNYITRQGLCELLGSGAKCIVAVDKVTKKVLGFSIFTRVDYDEVMSMTKNRPVPELNGETGIGYIKTVAVGSSYSGKGIGMDLIKRSMQILKSEGATSYISTAWKHAGITNVASLLKSVGFERSFELEEYWTQASIDEGFECPHCGNPCHCSCVIYTKSED